MSLFVDEIPGTDTLAYLLETFTAFAVESITEVPRVFGVERYTINGRTARLSQQPDALKVIGVVEQLAAYSQAECSQFAKSNAVKTYSDEFLRDVGWWSPGKTHANDATRMALSALFVADYPRWKLVRDHTMIVRHLSNEIGD